MRTDELRDVLRTHAEDVASPPASARLGEVRGRVAAVRRRRAAVAGGGVVAAVAVTALAVLPTLGTPTPAPAGPPEGVMTAEGYTKDGVTYRAEVLGEKLLGAVVGDPGEPAVSFEMTVPRAGLRISPTCYGVGFDHMVRVSVDGNELTGSACHPDPERDPGKDGNTFPDGSPLDRWDVRPGDVVTVEARLVPSDSELDVSAVEGEDAVVGVGIYEDTRPRTRLAGVEVPELIEWEGQVWQLGWKYESDPGHPDLRIWRDAGDSNGPDLTIAAVSGLRAPAKYTTLLDGQPEGGSEMVGTGAAGPSWETIGVLDAEDEGFRLRLRVDQGLTDRTRLGFATYTPVD